MSEEKGTGMRFNQGKLRYDLVQPYAHEQMVKILTKGADKYAERNWEKGMKWSNVISSLKRHLAAIERGEDFDKETGELHAAHLSCNAHFLTAYYKIYPEGDDRPHHYLNERKIGLDIDDVIADFVPAFMAKYNLEEPHNWHWSYKTEQHFKELMADPNELKKFYLSLKPKINPDDIPFEPHCYITSRSVPQEVTEQWIEENGFACKPVYTVPFQTSKIEVAKKSGIDTFVDDRYSNWLELTKAGFNCYLYDVPWNQRYDVGFKRIHSLSELV